MDGEAFDARDYLLTTAPEHERKHAQEDFDAREWFLMNPAEPETEATRMQRQLAEAGLPELHLEAGDEEGVFHFRYRVENPETFTTEQVHDQLDAALRQIGHTLVVAQIARVLDGGLTSGTVWLAPH
ncbi:MAG: hypothetical protein ABSH20_28880 [Tepidisphaeraceae bacterium]